MIINKQIAKGRTGSPSQLANYLGVSERTLHNYLSYMRSELKAPIKWSQYKGTYYYSSSGKLDLEWQIK